tara:strand:- start:66 stop:710 length:645 start_codon:yes stop_codon:yes gene_type:complete
MAQPTPEVTDEQLAAEAQDGSQAAFGMLVSRYHGRIYHFLCHKTASPEDAQDVTQQVFITAWQRIYQFRVEAKFATWLFTITRRLAINYYRARGSRVFVELEEADGKLVTHDTPASDLAERDEYALLWKTARENLSESQFTALWMKYREHMSIKEMAAAMGKKQVTVKVLLHRARKALGAALGGRGEWAGLNQSGGKLAPPNLERDMILQPGLA